MLCTRERATQAFWKSGDGSCCASVTSGKGRSASEEGARVGRLHRSRGMGRMLRGVVLDDLEGYRSAMMSIEVLHLI
jgi:hypothetical protein